MIERLPIGAGAFVIIAVCKKPIAKSEGEDSAFYLVATFFKLLRDHYANHTVHVRAGR